MKYEEREKIEELIIYELKWMQERLEKQGRLNFANEEQVQELVDKKCEEYLLEKFLKLNGYEEWRDRILEEVYWTRQQEQEQERNRNNSNKLWYEE